MQFWKENFRQEIAFLKGYVDRLNSELRDKLGLRQPYMDTLENKTNDEILNFYKMSLERLSNPEYLQPILQFYDKTQEELTKEVSF